MKMLQSAAMQQRWILFVEKILMQYFSSTCCTECALLSSQKNSDMAKCSKYECLGLMLSGAGMVVCKESHSTSFQANMQTYRSRQMIKTRYVLLSAFAFFVFATLLHAQGHGGGCTDSPEAPTALLMLVGFAGMFYGSAVLRKVLGRSGKR
jgi:XrtJ-associated TM-motif-TM protein